MGMERLSPGTDDLKAPIKDPKMDGGGKKAVMSNVLGRGCYRGEMSMATEKGLREQKKKLGLRRDKY